MNSKKKEINNHKKGNLSNRENLYNNNKTHLFLHTFTLFSLPLILKMDITAFTSFDQTFTHQPSPKNRVCISFYQRFQRFAIDDTDGTLVCTSLDPPLHFPSRQINLNLISHQSSPRHLFRLIDSRLQDRTLSRRIAEKIAAEAVRYVGFLQPYVMSVYVVKTQQVVSLREEEEETQKEEEEPTCAICLEGLYKNDDTFDLPYCSHRFHSTCIGEWLQNHDSCPLCREILLEENVETDFGLESFLSY